MSIQTCTHAGLYAEILQRREGEVGLLAKEEGAQLQAVSGGALEDNVKKLVH